MFTQILCQQKLYHDISEECFKAEGQTFFPSKSYDKFLGYFVAFWHENKNFFFLIKNKEALEWSELE
jgi:hypothetical protein